MSDDNLDLETLRRSAGLSQAQMGQRLGVSATQVGRYERDPESMSVWAYRRFRQYCKDAAASAGVALGPVDEPIRRRMALLRRYAEAAPTPPASLRPVQGRITDTIAEVVDGLQVLARKPRLIPYGAFDAGKSRLVNTLLGQELVPTEFQPTTSKPTLIRHRNDKPGWQLEDVAVMGPGFDINRMDEQAHFEHHRVATGSVRSLHDYARHGANPPAPIAAAAMVIVYAEAELLHGCDLVDMPGFGNSDQDRLHAEASHALADAVIYLSMAQGFMDESDINHLAALLKQLPVLGGEPAQAPLRNLYVLASRADNVGEGIAGVLDDGCERVYAALADSLQSRGQRHGQRIDPATLRRRFFSFSADEPTYRQAFEADLRELLGELYPPMRQHELEREVSRTRRANVTRCAHQIERLRCALHSHGEAKAELERILEREPQRRHETDAQHHHIEQLIDTLRTSSIDAASAIYHRQVNTDAIEGMIRERFTSKRNAQRYAPTAVLDALESQIEQAVQQRAEHFAGELDAFLGHYNSSVGAANAQQGTSFDFDARAVFVSALGGIGTLGALSAWAAFVAGGSNLGGYILVAKIASLLSSLGITLGGTATVIQLVAATGGPVTWGIAASVIAGAGIAAATGDDWETKLARQITKKLTKAGAWDQIEQGIHQFWDDTLTGFRQASDELERHFQQYIDSMREMTESGDPQDLQKRIDYLEQVSAFFSGLPWEPMHASHDQSTPV